MTVTAELLEAVPAAPPDRRQSPRHKLAQPIAAIIGRASGVLVDLSATGARIRHTGAIARGAQVRVTFEWKDERFEAAGEVLASRVAGIAAGGTLFESRVRFLPLTRSASALLETTLAGLGDGDVRRWVANLRGWTDGDAAPAVSAGTSPAHGFIRCRFVKERWEQRFTRDAAVPEDGFTVPGETDPSEIRLLRRAFEESDAEGRRFLQILTGAVLEQPA